MVSSTSGPPPRPTRPSFTQVAASALAAVSAAVISSTFGVAGTLIGAAIASIVASVGSTLYLASLRHTNERLRRMAVAARRTDWSGGTPTRPVPQGTPATAVHEPELPFPSAVGPPAGQAPEVTEAEAPSGWDRLRWSNLRRGLPTLRRRWPAVAGLTVLVFAIAIGVLTAVGASTQQPSFPLGGTGGSGKSPTSPASPTSSPSKATPTPTTAPSASSSATASPSSGATPSASPSAGSTPSPAPGATSPAPTPSPSPSVGVTQSPSPSPATVP